MITCSRVYFTKKRRGGGASRERKKIYAQISLQNLRRTTTIKDINDVEMPAKSIFTMAIRYLKEHLLSTVRQRVDSFTDDLVRWVVTVPAIWDEGAKQFMEEAAVDVSTFNTDH